MIFNHQYSEQKYPTSSLRSKYIENVNKYKYLGCEIKYNKASTGETELSNLQVLLTIKKSAQPQNNSINA